MRRVHQRANAWYAITIATLIVVPMCIGCGKTPSPTPQAVVIVASVTANEPAPVLSASDRQLLYQVGGASTDGVAYVVNPNTGQPTTVVLTPLRPDGQVEYGPRRRLLLEANVNRVQRLLDSEAATVPFDMLADIEAGVRVVSSPATLLVLSSGLSTAGAFDLRLVGWDANPRVAADDLRGRGLLPDLDGWRVIFSGLGDTAAPQPKLPLPQQTTLRTYWLAICQAARARWCTVDNLTRPMPQSRSTRPVPIVAIPRILPIRGPAGWTGASVPTDEFFAFGSSRLLPGANVILRPIVAKAITQHLFLRISGYASPDGGSLRFNKLLSQARALAVRDRVIELGLPARQIVRFIGLGTDARTAAACYRNGQLSEVICARLRRVVILLSRFSTSSRPE